MVTAALGSGLLSFFSPCILPLLPVYAGMLATDASAEKLPPWRRVANTAAFVLGISFTFVALGMSAAGLGSLFNSSYLAIGLGIVVIVLGLHLADVIEIPALERRHQADMGKIQVRGAASAFLLGLAFSFGWTPCVGPILGSILALAADTGDVLAGGALLLAYSAGLCVPFIALTLASGALMARLKGLGKHLPAIKRAGGALIAIMGIWMVFSQVQLLVNAAAPVEEAGEVQAAQEVQAEGAGADGEGADGAGSDGASEGGSLLEADRSQALAGISTAWRNVALRDLEGNTVRFSDLKGEPVYFEFWGSWCSSCVADLGQLKELYAEHAAKGDVQVVSVVTPGSYGEKDADDFVAWAAEQGVDFPVYMDMRASLVQYIGVAGFPTSVFVNADGDIVKVRVGAVELDELEDMLDQLAAGEMG